MKKQLPKVSVIIPVYNTEPYLHQCLDSVINQTLTDIEIICIDDGSIDNSMNILKEYHHKDARITILEQPHSNAGSARNRGLAVATGKYLAFLDSDDYFDLNMLKMCYGKMEHDNSDIAIFKAQQFDVKTKITTPMPWSLRIEHCPSHSPFSPSEMNQFLFNSFQNWPWNKMFRKEFINKYHIVFQEIPRTNDMAFVCKALAEASSISIIDQILVTYRVGTGNSLQSTNDKTPLSFWDACLETKRQLKETQKFHLYEQSFLNAVLSGMLYNYRSVKSELSRNQIQQLVYKNAYTGFKFLKRSKEYYYDQRQYNEYTKILEFDKGKSKRNYVTSPTIHSVIHCIHDHGIIYTMQYALKRILH